MAVRIETRRQVRLQAGERCGYCLTRQEHIPWTLEIEHLIPSSKGGSDEAWNLWLACHSCNLFKSDQTNAIDPLLGHDVPLFNPREQDWFEHFEWGKKGEEILGKTPVGRATVVALKLNNIYAITVRRAWVSAGWHPPVS